MSYRTSQYANFPGGLPARDISYRQGELWCIGHDGNVYRSLSRDQWGLKHYASAIKIQAVPDGVYVLEENRSSIYKVPATAADPTTLEREARYRPTAFRTEIKDFVVTTDGNYFALTTAGVFGERARVAYTSSTGLTRYTYEFRPLSGNLDKISGLDSNTIWGISGTTPMRWEGGQWTSLSGSISDIAIADDGWKVGINTSKLIVYWDGAAFRTDFDRRSMRTGQLPTSDQIAARTITSLYAASGSRLLNYYVSRRDSSDFDGQSPPR